jgi:hypothetical protein
MSSQETEHPNSKDKWKVVHHQRGMGPLIWCKSDSSVHNSKIDAEACKKNTLLHPALGGINYAIHNFPGNIAA